MPGKICAVASCKNNQETLRRLGSNVMFHRFPKTSDCVSSTIRKAWIQRCQRADKFNVDNSRICSNHFTSNDYERDLKNELLGLPLKKVLKKTAVPTINLKETLKGATTAREKRAINKERKEVVHTLLASRSMAPSINRNPSTVGNSSTTDEIPESYFSDDSQVLYEIEIEHSLDSTETRYFSLEVEAEDQEENENSYKSKYESLLQKYNNLKLTSRKKIKGLSAMLTYYKNKFYKSQNMATDKTSAAAKLLGKVLTKNQISILSRHKKIVHWTQEEISLAFTLRYYNRKCYVFLRKNLNYPLPSISSLKHWASSLEIGCGLLADVLLMMKLAGEDLTKCERTVVLQFDEVKIKSIQQYDVAKDQVLGPHSQMQVIQARGLFSKWKQPVYIAFDQKVTKDILLNIITELHNISYDVVACVSDCGGGNVGLWTELQVNINKTFFKHPNAESNVYIFADAPHLLKLVRNGLLDTGFIMDGKRKITKEPLQALVDLTNREVNSGWKLSQIHLNVDKSQRQNVRLAAQVLSNSVSTALTRYKPGNDPKNAEDLGEFIGDMDKWFDIFNSYMEDGKAPTKSAYGDRHLEIQKEHLDKMISTIYHMRAIGEKSLQLFQKGMIISIKSLQSLFKDMKEKFHIHYICTYKLNQDALENFFSQIQCRGSNEHPSPLTAIYRIRMTILGKNAGILDSKVNTEERVNEETITPKIFEKAKLKLPEPDIYEEPIGSNSSSSFSSVSTSDASRNTSFQDNSTETTEDTLEYIAGWLAKKYKESLPELGDFTYEIKSDHSYNIPSWVQQLSFEGLIKPTPQWLEKIEKWNRYFEMYHKNSIQKGPGIVFKLAMKIKKRDNMAFKLIFDFCKLRTIIRINYNNHQASFKNGSKRKSTHDCNRSRAKKLKKIIV